MMQYSDFCVLLLRWSRKKKLAVKVSAKFAYTISNGNKKIDIARGYDAFANDVILTLHNINISSCPYKYAYDSSDRNTARIVIPVNEFKKHSVAMNNLKWILSLLIKNEKKSLIFRILEFFGL